MILLAAVLQVVKVVNLPVHVGFDCSAVVHEVAGLSVGFMPAFPYFLPCSPLLLKHDPTPGLLGQASWPQKMCSERQQLFYSQPPESVYQQLLRPSVRNNRCTVKKTRVKVFNLVVC